MLGPEMNTGLDAGSIQKMCGAASVPGLEFGENLTSLLPTMGVGTFGTLGAQGAGVLNLAPGA